MNTKTSEEIKYKELFDKVWGATFDTNHTYTSKEMGIYYHGFCKAFYGFLDQERLKISQLEKQVGILKTALEFYANESNYNVFYYAKGGYDTTVIELDSGEKAQITLGEKF